MPSPMSVIGPMQRSGRSPEENPRPGRGNSVPSSAPNSPSRSLDPAGSSANPAPLHRDSGARDPAAAGPRPDPGEPSDADCVRRAQRGDQNAFELLVRRHQARALRVAKNLVADPEEAQDLAQEAFLRVFRSLDRFDFQHEFSTWLYRIVTNVAIDHLRRRRVAVSTSAGSETEGGEIELPDDKVLAPSRRMEAGETAARVRACIGSLAPHFQSVLVLRELEGLPCTEIARIVGATHVTVRWRLHRGRKLFQEEWERRERMAAAGQHELANEPTPYDVSQSVEAQGPDAFGLEQDR